MPATAQTTAKQPKTPKATKADATAKPAKAHKAPKAKATTDTAPPATVVDAPKPAAAEKVAVIKGDDVEKSECLRLLLRRNLVFSISRLSRITVPLPRSAASGRPHRVTASQAVL